MHLTANNVLLAGRTHAIAIYQGNNRGIRATHGAAAARMYACWTSSELLLLFLCGFLPLGSGEEPPKRRCPAWSFGTP